MDRLNDEINVYKTIAAINGRTPFRYNVTADYMEFYFANDDMAGYGSTMNNYVMMLKGQSNMAGHNRIKVDDLIDCLTKDDCASPECEARLSFHGEEPRWYRVKAVRQKCNDVTYLTGEFTDINSQKSGDGFSESADEWDPPTGLLSKSALKRRFAEKCIQQNGGEGAFLDILVDGFRARPKEVNERIIINMGLCLRRIFDINAYVGRGNNNEFFVVCYGKNSRDSIAGVLDALRNEVSKMQGEEFNSSPVTLSCGIYMGPFNAYDDYDIREKAHMALLTAKRKGGGATVWYTEDSHEEYVGADSIDAVFVQELLENALEKMSTGSRIEDVVYECFSTVGTKFGLDRIFVHELNEKTKEVYNSYNWYTPLYPYVEGIVQRNRLMEYDVLSDIYANQKIIAVSDAENYSGNEELMSQIRAKGLKSFVRCIFDGGHGIKGCVGYECYVGRHEWSEGELRVFKTVSQLISSFLLNVREYDNLITETVSNDRYDYVTGLIKYDYFLEDAKKLIKDGTDGQYAIVYLGFMDFMSVNARYGYDAGNMLLKGLAELLGQSADRVILASRINADNYVALVNTYDSRGSAISPEMVTSLGDIFDGRYGRECPGVDISFNAGIAIITDIELPVDDYIKKAYAAKGFARNMGGEVFVAE